MKGVIWALSKELLLVGNYKPTIQISCKPNSKPGPLSESWVHTIIIIIIIILYMLNEAYKKGIYYIISLKLIYLYTFLCFLKLLLYFNV